MKHVPALETAENVRKRNHKWVNFS